MPLEIEQYCRARQKFVKVWTLGPADETKEISSHKGSGNVEMVIFERAPDDSGSTIFRSTSADTDEGEVIKRLSKGESFMMEILINHGRNSKSVIYYITHR